MPVLLLAVAVLLGAFAGFAAERAHRLRANATTNTALTDSAATSEVTGQVTSAINTIFSYDYTDLAETQRAASGLLTGAATCQYNQLFTSIQQQAPQQKLVVTVTVTNTGVELLDGDRARLLVFATQSSTSAVSKRRPPRAPCSPLTRSATAAPGGSPASTPSPDRSPAADPTIPLGHRVQVGAGSGTSRTMVPSGLSGL